MGLRVLMIAERHDRAQLLEQALTYAHHRTAGAAQSCDDLYLSARRLQPDALIVESETLPGSVLQQLQRLHLEQPIPVVVFVDRSDSETIQAAVRAGVSSYVVDGFAPERVQPVLATAIARFNEFQALRSERDGATVKLKERKSIERAKGILMRRRNLPEDTAYQALRRMAMDRGQRLHQVAENIITAEEMLAEG